MWLHSADDLRRWEKEQARNSSVHTHPGGTTTRRTYDGMRWDEREIIKKNHKYGGPRPTVASLSVLWREH